jgi:hypothetical protein
MGFRFNSDHLLSVGSHEPAYVVLRALPTIPVDDSVEIEVSFNSSADI